MKKLLLLITLSIILSCSSDSSSNEEVNNIIGKWTYEVETDYDSNGNVLMTYDWSESPCYHMTSYDYKSNGQVVKVSFDYEATCIQNPTRTYNYTINEDVLTTTGAGISEQQIIIENTEPVLILKTVREDNTYTIMEYSKL